MAPRMGRRVRAQAPGPALLIPALLWVLAIALPMAAAADSQLASKLDARPQETCGPFEYWQMSARKAARELQQAFGLPARGPQLVLVAQALELVEAKTDLPDPQSRAFAETLAIATADGGASLSPSTFTGINRAYAVYRLKAAAAPHLFGPEDQEVAFEEQQDDVDLPMDDEDESTLDINGQFLRELPVNGDATLWRAVTPETAARWVNMQLWTHVRHVSSVRIWEALDQGLVFPQAAHCLGVAHPPFARALEHYRTALQHVWWTRKQCGRRNPRFANISVSDFSVGHVAVLLRAPVPGQSNLEAASAGIRGPSTFVVLPDEDGPGCLYVLAAAAAHSKHTPHDKTLTILSNGLSHELETMETLFEQWGDALVNHVRRMRTRQLRLRDVAGTFEDVPGACVVLKKLIETARQRGFLETLDFQLLVGIGGSATDVWACRAALAQAVSIHRAALQLDVQSGANAESYSQHAQLWLSALRVRVAQPDAAPIHAAVRVVGAQMTPPAVAALAKLHVRDGSLSSLELRGVPQSQAALKALVGALKGLAYPRFGWISELAGFNKALPTLHPYVLELAPPGAGTQPLAGEDWMWSLARFTHVQTLPGLDVRVPRPLATVPAAVASFFTGTARLLEVSPTLKSLRLDVDAVKAWRRLAAAEQTLWTRATSVTAEPAAASRELSWRAAIGQWVTRVARWWRDGLLQLWRLRVPVAPGEPSEERVAVDAAQLRLWGVLGSMRHLREISLGTLLLTESLNSVMWAGLLEQCSERLHTLNLSFAVLAYLPDAEMLIAQVYADLYASPCKSLVAVSVSFHAVGTSARPLDAARVARLIARAVRQLPPDGPDHPMRVINGLERREFIRRLSAPLLRIS